MGRIKFGYVYSNLVEFYFRSVIRHRQDYIPEKWYKFTAVWINQLNQDDRNFITFVFGKQFDSITNGLACYMPKGKSADEPTSCEFEIKRKLLLDLEKQFALDSGIISNAKKKSDRH